MLALQLVDAGAGRVQDLAAQRQDRLGLARARLLGRAAGGIALDQKNLGAAPAIRRAVGELAGQAQLAGRGLAHDLLGALAGKALLGAPEHMLEHGAAGLGVAREPVVEVILDAELDLAAGIGRHQPVLGLALELRMGREQREQRAGGTQQVVGGDLRRLLVAGQLAIGPQRAQKGRPQRLLVRAALRRRHGVAVEAKIRLLVERPGDRPLDPALTVGELGLAHEGQLGDALALGQHGPQEILEPGREMEHLVLGHIRHAGEQGSDRNASGSRRRETGTPCCAPCGAAASA